MDVKKLNNVVDSLKENLGKGLLSCDIWITGTGQAIASFNPQPKATALFEEVTEYVNKTLKSAGFPGLSDYYLLDLDDNSSVVIIQKGKYQGGILIDKDNTNLGLLLNVAIPEALKGIEAADEG